MLTLLARGEISVRMNSTGSSATAASSTLNWLP